MSEFAPRHLPNGWQRLSDHALAGQTPAMRWLHASGLSVLMGVEDQGDGGLWLHLSLARADVGVSHATATAMKDLFLGPEVCALRVVPPLSARAQLDPRCAHVWARLDADTAPVEIW